ncbi:MAG: FHA domain-containing protein [Chromatiales bacterium]
MEPLFDSAQKGWLADGSPFPVLHTLDTWAAQAQSLTPAQHVTWVWYAVPAAFLLGVLAALSVYGRLQQRRRRGTKPHKQTAASQMHAYLVQQGDEIVRYVIQQTPCRIGRSERNELTFKHPSISRQHAQIDRRRDGLFEITDLESLNGVFVNDKKVKTSSLAEGDIIDIGDLTFRFTGFDTE